MLWELGPGLLWGPLFCLPLRDIACDIASSTKCPSSQSYWDILPDNHIIPSLKAHCLLSSSLLHQALWELPGGGGGLVTKLCLTLHDPMDCSQPGSSVHGISQARILEWVTMSFSRGSSRPGNGTCVSWIAGRFFTTEPPGKPIVSPSFLYALPGESHGQRSLAGYIQSIGSQRVRYDWALKHTLPVFSQPLTSAFALKLHQTDWSQMASMLPSQ